MSGSQSGSSAEAEAGLSCGGDKTPPMKTPLLCLRRKAGACQTDIDGELQVAGNGVAQRVNKLNVMEDKIKRREANQRKSWAHLEAVRRYAVDFTNLVEGHEEMLAELPWLMKHGGALTDRPISMNLQASKLSQQLMTVTQRAVTAEKAIQALEAERTFSECGRPLPGEAGEHLRGILRLPHLLAQKKQARKKEPVWENIFWI